MWKQNWVIALGIVSGFAGTVQHWQRANGAVPPNACPEWECKNITYLWDGLMITENGQKVGAIELFAGANSNPPTIALQGFQSIFAQSSGYKLPQKNVGNVDIWTYTSCVPSCGLDQNKVWQLPQEVSPAGKHSNAPYKQGAVQNSCTSTAPGVPGLSINPPVNSNKGKQTPPGWSN